MIAILCPTYRRPKLAKRMWDSVNGAARVYFCTDSIDLMDCKLSGIETIDYLYADPHMPTAMKWNMLAEEAMKDPDNKLFMLGADDMVFETPGWDKALLEHYSKLENKVHVYALQDSRDVDGAPHIIVTREYIERMGYFVPPIFLHWFVDSWTVEIAKDNNCFTRLRDFKLTHDKPSDQGKADETHSRIRQWGWHERDKYVSEKMAHVLEGEKRRLEVLMKTLLIKNEDMDKYDQSISGITVYRSPDGRFWPT